MGFRCAGLGARGSWVGLLVLVFGGGVVDLGDVGCGCVGGEDGGLEYGGGIVGVCRCR